MKTDEVKAERIRVLELWLATNDFDELQVIGANKALEWLDGLSLVLSDFVECLKEKEQTDEVLAAIKFVESKINKLAFIRCNLRDFAYLAEVE